MSQNKTTALPVLRSLRWLLVDAVTHASHVAARASEATEGTEEMILFDAARKAISDFCAEHPAMKALTRAALKGYL